MNRNLPVEEQGGGSGLASHDWQLGSAKTFQALLKEYFYSSILAGSQISLYVHDLKMVDLTHKSKYLRARLCNHDSILGFTDQVSFRRITIRCELRPGDRPDLRLDFCSSWSLISKCFWTWKENWCHPNILSIWSRMIWCLLFLMIIVSHNNGDSAK